MNQNPGPISGPLFYDYGVSASKRCDGADGNPHRSEHYAYDAKGERYLEQDFSRVALDGDLPRVSFANDFLHLLEKIITGNLVLFGALG